MPLFFICQSVVVSVLLPRDPEILIQIHFYLTRKARKQRSYKEQRRSAPPLFADIVVHSYSLLESGNGLEMRSSQCT